MSAADLIDQIEAEFDGAVRQVVSLVNQFLDEWPDRATQLRAQIAQLQEELFGLQPGWTATETGDWATAREVARWQGLDSSHTWNEGDTTAWLLTQGPFTHAVMTTVLGDNWIHVVALVRRAAGLTPTERSTYAAAWLDDYYAHQAEYDAAWRAVFVGGGPGYAALRALCAFVGVVGCASVGAALARRSEVDPEHYEVRTRVWRRMFGPIHPDDAEAF